MSTKDTKKKKMREIIIKNRKDTNVTDEALYELFNMSFAASWLVNHLLKHSDGRDNLLGRFARKIIH